MLNLCLFYFLLVKFIFLFNFMSLQSYPLICFALWCYIQYILQLLIRMNNKFVKKQSYRSRRKNNLTPFTLNLSHTQERSNSLFYSNTQQKLIQLQKIQPNNIQESQPLEFLADNHAKKHCGRRDCVDRQFQGIKKLNKSTPNVKIVSPRKVDIILSTTSQSIQLKKYPSIHSYQGYSKKLSPQKDLLKQFKMLQLMRKQLRSRNFQNSSRFALQMNTVRNSKTSQVQRQIEQNPEKSNRSSLYNQVKNRISKRYNNMFKKFSQGYKQQIKAQNLFLKDICSAKSLRRKQKQIQN